MAISQSPKQKVQQIADILAFSMLYKAHFSFNMAEIKLSELVVFEYLYCTSVSTQTDNQMYGINVVYIVEFKYHKSLPVMSSSNRLVASCNANLLIHLVNSQCAAVENIFIKLN